MCKLNYIEYYDLSEDDYALFLSAGLPTYLLDIVNWSGLDINIRDDNYSENRTGFLKDNKNYINQGIQYALELIGEHSNSEFGSTAEEQHKFFKRTAEQENFSTLLYMAIQKQKSDFLQENSEDGKQLAHMEHPYVADNYLELARHHKKTYSYFENRGKKLAEEQVYGFGAFYLVNFIFHAVKENNAARVSKLISEMSHFKSQEEYKPVYGREGSKKSVMTRNIAKDRMYKVFVKKDIKNEFGPSHEAMAAEIYRLKPKKLKVSPSTILKKWVPDFLKRME